MTVAGFATNTKIRRLASLAQDDARRARTPGEAASLRLSSLDALLGRGFLRRR